MAPPTKQNAYLWAQRSPGGFIFHVKVYAVMTGHAVDPRSLPPDIRNELPTQDKGQKYVYVKESELVRAIFDRSEELKEFMPHILTSAKTAKVTYVMFNNCHGGSAMRNARRMKELMKG